MFDSRHKLYKLLAAQRREHPTAADAVRDDLPESVWLCDGNELQPKADMLIIRIVPIIAFLSLIS